MDNFNENINNNLEDKAWASMKVLLDKELPEVVAPTLSDIDSKEKKKRRFLFFYLCLLGLIGTGLGYFIYAKNRDLNNVKNELVNNIVNINKTEKSNNSNDINLVKKGGNTEGVVSQNTTLIQTDKTTKNLDKNNLVYSNNDADLIGNKKLQNIDNQLVTKENDINLKSKNNAQNISDIELNNPYKVIEKDIYYNIQNDINSANLIKNNTEIKKENNIVIEAKKEEKEEPYIASIKSISNIDLVDILQPQPIYFDDKNELSKDYNSLKSIHKINLKKWSFGLVLGLNTEGSTKILTGFGGMFLQRNLSAKWSINTGINYRILAKNVTNVEYLQTADSLLNKSKSAVPTSTSNNLLRVNKAYLKNLYYWEIPIQINYNLSKKVSIFSGAKIAYLISQNVSTNKGDQPLFITSQYASFDVNRVINESRYTSSDLGLNKWDVGLVGGVNYNFSKRFSTQLRYDLGITNIYQGNNAAVYNRFIGLNVAYRF